MDLELVFSEGGDLPTPHHEISGGGSDLLGTYEISGGKVNPNPHPHPHPHPDPHPNPNPNPNPNPHPNPNPNPNPSPNPNQLFTEAHTLEWLKPYPTVHPAFAPREAGGVSVRVRVRVRG